VKYLLIVLMGCLGPWVGWCLLRESDWRDGGLLESERPPLYVFATIYLFRSIVLVGAAVAIAKFTGRIW
jgi:uncharacterized Tic20 family protein